jgi:hypothetical protein
LSCYGALLFVFLLISKSKEKRLAGLENTSRPVSLAIAGKATCKPIDKLFSEHTIRLSVLMGF